MEDFARVNNTLNEENVFTYIIFFVQNAEFGKLGTPRGYVHVRLWSLKAITIQCWFKGLNNVLPVVLICGN